MFNADYRGVRPVSKGFPESIDDVACAIRFARANTAKYGGDPDHIVLVGHSMGGYVGMMVSVAGNRFAGKGRAASWTRARRCRTASCTSRACPSRRPREPLDAIFFGGSQAAIPEVWRRGNVFHQIALGGNRRPQGGHHLRARRPVPGLRPRDLAPGRPQARRATTSELVLLDEGSTHFDVLDMDTALGRRILAFTERVIRRSAP